MRSSIIGSFRLSPLELALLGAVLAAIAIVVPLLGDVSQGVYLLVLVVVLTAGALGATAADASQLVSFIPPRLAVPLTVLAQVLAGVIALGGLSETLQAILGGALTFLTTIGLNPLRHSPAPAAAQQAPVGPAG